MESMEEYKEENKDEKKEFSVTARANSLKHALRGVSLFFKTQHNAWLQLAIAVLVVGAGLYFNVTTNEWALLVIAITAVFVAEAFNTAIEIDIDLTSPEYHPYAKNTKDVAAGAVLLAVIGAVLIGCLVFWPYFQAFLF